MRAVRCRLGPAFGYCGAVSRQAVASNAPFRRQA